MYIYGRSHERMVVDEATRKQRHLNAAAAQKWSQRSTCSRFSPTACSLWLEALPFLSSCGYHIERSTFVNPMEEYKRFFFLPIHNSFDE